MQSIYDQLLTTLYMVWRKRWHGLITMWIVCLVGWGIVATIPDVYEARARIFVDTNEVLPALVNTETLNPLREVDIVRRTLLSRPNLERVIRRTDMDLTVENESEMERLITDLTENISLISQGDDLFTVKYASGNPRLSKEDNANLAKRVVQNLIMIFIDENMKGQREVFNETRRFLDEQIAEYERQLEAAERRKADFERENLGMLPEGTSFSQQIQNLRRELDDVNQRLMQARSSRAALAAQLASQPATIPGALFSLAPTGDAPSYDPTSTEGRIFVLEQQISEAIARGYTAQHPDIVTARKQIAELQKQPRAERPRSNAASRGPQQANPVYVDLSSRVFEKDSEVAALSARQASLNAEIAALRGKAESAPGLEAERSKLNRDYDVLNAKYQELLASREETVVAQRVEQTTQKVQFTIVDPPEVPLKPVAPNRPLLLAGVTFGGLMAGIAMAVAMSQMHTTYVSLSSLRNRTNLPVLGGVSAILGDQQVAQDKLRLGLFAIAFLGLIGVFTVLLVLESIQRGQAI